MSGFPPSGGPFGTGRGAPNSRGTRSTIFGQGEERPRLDPRPGNDLAAGRSRSLPHEFGRLPGIDDPLGLNQLGRADLDPFTPLGPGTGMLADPRGIRQPPTSVPPNHVPGARFDPYGPVPPPPPNFGRGIPRPRAPEGAPAGSPASFFGGPAPDHLPMNPFPGEDPRGAVQDQRRNPPPFGGPSPDEPPPTGYDDMFS